MCNNHTSLKTSWQSLYLGSANLALSTELPNGHGTLAAAVIYTELRQRRFKPTPSQDRIFRCTKCGSVYTDDPDVDRSRCVQCGQLNEAIEF